ncbi:MAG TPA: indole-3-glycerol phosphate synthase TrpC [Dehalococcoidia bacterium]|nr:indole-3-glycerol phosphate synthase TrpC [Dehalococcoidia bacterium]
MTASGTSPSDAEESVLDRIVREMRDELPARREAVPEQQLKWMVMEREEPRDFLGTLLRPGLGVIAEVKRGSPSKGAFAREINGPGTSRIFRDGGACAISVLTSKYFFADNQMLLDIGEALLDDERRWDKPVPPLLRKEFHLDRYHVLEARALGADAFLLIVKTMDEATLRDLVAYGQEELGMTAFLEVTEEQEVETALNCGARVIGINNRNLHNFSEDLGTTERVRGFIPDDIAVVAASGIHSLRGMERMKAANVNAVLVGEALTTADDIPAKLRELQGSDTEAGDKANGDTAIGGAS